MSIVCVVVPVQALHNLILLTFSISYPVQLVRYLNIRVGFSAPTTFVIHYGNGNANEKPQNVFECVKIVPLTVSNSQQLTESCTLKCNLHSKQFCFQIQAKRKCNNKLREKTNL